MMLAHYHYSRQILIRVRTAEIFASHELQVRLAYPKRMGNFIDHWLNARQTGPLSALSN